MFSKCLNPFHRKDVIKNKYDTIGFIREIQVFTKGRGRLGKGPWIELNTTAPIFATTNY